MTTDLKSLPLLENEEQEERTRMHDDGSKSPARSLRSSRMAKRSLTRKISVDSAALETLVLGSQSTLSSTGWRREVWLFMSSSVSETGCRRWARKYEYFSVGLVICNVMVDICASMDDKRDSVYIKAFQYSSCTVYAIEYVLRLWSCVEDPALASKGACCARVTYAFRFWPLVDLIVILSTCMMYFQPRLVGLRTLRLVRIARLLLLLKTDRRGNSFSRVWLVVLRKRKELVATFYSALILLIVSATLMYNLEHDVQPEVFPTVISAMWWSTAALTTVGYGDAVPVTAGGKFLASLVAFFGIGIFSLPAGILSSGFVEVLQEEEEEQQQAVDDVGAASESEQPEVLEISAVMSEVQFLRKSLERMHGDMDDLKNGQAQILALLMKEDLSKQLK